MSRENFTKIASFRDTLALEVDRAIKDWKNQLSTKKDFAPEEENVVLDCIKVLDLLVGEFTKSPNEELRAKIREYVEYGKKALNGVILLHDNTTGKALDESVGIFQLASKYKELRFKTDAPSSTPNSAASTPTSLTSSAVVSLGGAAPPAINVVLKNHQIIFSFKSCVLQVGEETELYFSLWNNTPRKPMTEEFQINLNKSGVPVDILQEHKLTTIVKDVEQNDIDLGLLLVCRVIRKGKLVEGDTKKATNIQDYRRPFAVGVVNLQPDIIKQDKIDISMPFFYCAETLYSTIIDLITSKSPNVQPRQGEIKGTVQIARSTTFKDLLQSEKYRSNPLTQKFVLSPDGIFEEPRHDLYITIDNGEFKEGQNVEVVVDVRFNDGERVKDCIISGVGTKPVSEFRSVVWYHTNSPHWSETLKLSVSLPLCLHRSHATISEQAFSKAHLRFTRHDFLSAKPPAILSFAFLKLVQSEEAFIEDGEYNLSCYKPMGKNPKDETKVYLQDPEALQKLLKKSEQLRYASALPLLTPQGSILKCINWKKHMDNIPDIVSSLTFIDQLEIMKFFQNIFDALFEILESKTGNMGFMVEPVAISVADCDGYNAITFILCLLLSAGRYNFRKLLDDYIDKHFQGTLTHRHLISCFGFFLGSLEAEKNISFINTSIRALDYLFKFVEASLRNCEKHNKATAESERVLLKKELMEVANYYCVLLQKNSSPLLVCQTLALKSLVLYCQRVEKYHSSMENAKMIASFLDAAIYSDKSKSINTEFYAFIRWLIVDTAYFVSNETRKVILPPIIKQVLSRMEKHEEKAECIQVVKVILNCIQTQIDENSRRDAIWQVSPLLNSLIAAAGGRGDIVDSGTCLYLLLHLLDEEQYNQVFASISSQDELRQFYINLFWTLETSLGEKLYPYRWISMWSFQVNTLMKVISIASTAMIKRAQLFSALESNQDDKDAELEVWTGWMDLLIAFVLDKGIQLDKLPPAQQSELSSRFGEKRPVIGAFLKKTWESLKEHQFLFLSSSGKFLSMLGVHMEEIRELVASLMYDILASEVESTGSIEKTEENTIEALDKLVGQKKLAEELFQGFFSERLEQKLKQNEKLSKIGAPFLLSMSKLLQLLFDMRTLPEDPAYEQERVTATMRLMEYLKKTSRREAYIRYVHVLCNQQESRNNFTEAAFTLLLHADLLNWVADVCKPFSLFSFQSPQESQRSRKERLYKLAIDYFDKGKYWEKGIELIEELKALSETEMNYQRYIELLELEASFYEKIAKSKRFFPEFFRVGFYGKGFPPNVQGKEFIYKGEELEKTAEFVSKITTQFPNAELLKSTAEPSLDILTKEVAPSPTMEGETHKQGKPKTKVPLYITKAQNKFKVNTFAHSRPFRKAEKKSDNEFSDLWLSTTYLTTEYSFPCIYKRSMVVSKQQRELGPLENAVNSIETKTQELLELVEEFEDRSRAEAVNISPLSMAINGVIDAAVNGGIVKYQEAFLIGDENNEKYSLELKDKLRNGLRQQLEVIEKGLRLHARLITPEMRGLQEKLDTFFPKLKESVLKC